MKLLKLFTDYAPNKIFIAICLGALSGLAYAMLIPVIMSALEPYPERLSPLSNQAYYFWGMEIAHPAFAGIFLILCIVILLTRTTSQILLARVSMDVTSDLRKNLYKRIASTPISSLEQAKNGSLIQALTTDVQRIIHGASLIPDILIQTSTLIGLMGFLCYLNSDVFKFVLLIVFFGILTFQIPMIIGDRYFARARAHMNDLQEGYRGLIDGAKELKLNKEKARHFSENELLLPEKCVITLEKTGFTIVQVARNYGDMICFITMGAVGFIYVNYRAISIAELTGIIMVLLYITGPVAYILNVLPDIGRAKVSLTAFNDVLEQLPTEDIIDEVRVVPDWQTITISNVIYSHPSQDPLIKPFDIGPISAKIKRGTISFFVGGNGSGKSTFLKVLSLHYLNSGGSIKFDDCVITPENINSYRQQVACIYSDYYLFKKLHNQRSHNSELIEQVNYYLEILELKEKVRFENGQFSTIRLSDGQRRRLALLVAFLDDKVLYVFDEWAADQDPRFKQIFYLDLLPKLKAQGKAVVAITHDDRYFDVADQILVFERGTLIGKNISIPTELPELITN